MLVSYHPVKSLQLICRQDTSRFNTWRPRQNGRCFPDDIFKCVFLNEHVWISIKISPKFVPKSPINNIAALVQLMAWHQPGNKPLSEPMMVRLATHICVTQPQRVNQWVPKHKMRSRDLTTWQSPRIIYLTMAVRGPLLTWVNLNPSMSK